VICLRKAELAARIMAHGCNVYAPKQGTDPSEAMYNATRSGATSAACGERWMEARVKLHAAGLEPLELKE
jgi:hypothetical protein